MVKISLNTVTRECVADSTFLGFEGENQANMLDFSFSDKFVDGTAVLNIKRGKDTGFVSVDKVGSGYQLPVKSSLLSQVGEVTFQFVITTGDGAIMKFDPFVMTVEDAIDTDVPLPEEYPSWVEMANVKLAEIDYAIEQANATSSQILLDKANGEFNGKDGFSPSAKVVQTDDGAVLTVTDKDGTTSAIIKNGEGSGEGGGTGADGFSPIANVTETDYGAEVIITDKKGTTTAKIYNGKDGADGNDGNDGLTPHIGDNGNWWIGETDTGVPASGGSSSGSSGGFIEKTLFEGGLTVGGANGTLTDSILNYDFALVTVCADLEGWGINSLMQEIIVNTKNITFKGNSGAWDGFYDVYNSNGAGNWYRVCFGFVDETTITLGALTNGGNWKNAKIKKVTGYKINGGSSADNYSTDETVVGKWIDGKTLYQKTITGYKAPETTGDGKTASINADLSSLNIESFVYAEAILLDATSVRPIPTFWSSGSYGVQFYYNKTNDSLFIKNTSSNHNNADLIITIKYTKTSN